jgi:hypothetical protein
MQRGRSSSTKRLKEQARQQKQRNKAEGRNERRQERSQAPAEDLERLSTGTETDRTLLGSEADVLTFTNQQPGLPDSQNELSQKHTPRQ